MTDEKDLEKLFEEASRKGAVLCLLHFDAYGEKAEDVKNALVELTGRITGEKNILYCTGEIEEPMEREEKDGKKAFSTYAEVRVLASSFENMMNLCLRYAPIAIEIEKPREVRLNTEQMQNVLLNASSVSQQYTNYFMQKLLKNEDFDKFQEHLKQRAEMGKKLIEKAKEDEKKT